jgi:hypothetical protein
MTRKIVSDTKKLTCILIIFAVLVFSFSACVGKSDAQNYASARLAIARAGGFEISDFSDNSGIRSFSAVRKTFNAVFDSSEDENQFNLFSRLHSTRDRIESLMRAEGYTESTIVVEDTRIRVEVSNVGDPERLFRHLGEPPKVTFEIYDSVSEPADNPYTGITGRMIRNATTTNFMGGFAVMIEFDREGERLFYEVTSANIGKFIRIAVNDQTVSVAEIKEAIAGGKPVMSGNFTSEEAQSLALQIGSASFDVKLTLVEADTIQTPVRVFLYPDRDAFEAGLLVAKEMISSFPSEFGEQRIYSIGLVLFYGRPSSTEIIRKAIGGTPVPFVLGG